MSCLVCHLTTRSVHFGGPNAITHLDGYGRRLNTGHEPVAVVAWPTSSVGGPMAGNDWLDDAWNDLFATYDEVGAASIGGHDTTSEVERFAKAQQNLVDAVVEVMTR